MPDKNLQRDDRPQRQDGCMNRRSHTRRRTLGLPQLVAPRSNPRAAPSPGRLAGFRHGWREAEGSRGRPDRHRHARPQRGPHACLHGLRDPGRVGRRHHPRGRQVDRRDRRNRAQPAIRVIWHPHNVGYGGNQKTCYLAALQEQADVVVMLHPDGQYEPTLIPDLVRPILRGEADVVLGSRMAVPGMARAAACPATREWRTGSSRRSRIASWAPG